MGLKPERGTLATRQRMGWRGKRGIPKARVAQEEMTAVLTSAEALEKEQCIYQDAF